MLGLEFGMDSGLGRWWKGLAGEGEQGRGVISEAQVEDKSRSRGSQAEVIPPPCPGAWSGGSFGCHSLRGVGRAAPALKQVEAWDAAQHTTAHS